jgi:tRNA(Ile)-lysidine synthetase-like protein
MISLSKKIFSLAEKNERVVLLCSSGVDSIAVSHYFLKKFGKKIDVSLLHFNHRLRSQNDKMEASFQAFASSLYASWQVQRLSCKSKTEDACRQARLEHLNLYKNVTFITAHHLDDCAESYLLNSIRGKEGFLPVPFHTELDEGNCINRPFIFNRKKDYIAYAEHHDLLKYVVEDETNLQVRGSRRNLIRNELLPILEREKVGLTTIVKKKMLERLNNL